MFVGASDVERGEQLRNLEMILNGYALAVHHHHLQEPVTDFPRQFATYLSDRFGWSAAAGPIAAVRDASSNDEEAWNTFWRLVSEFRASLLGEC
jgi:hypothetical protein